MLFSRILAPLSIAFLVGHVSACYQASVSQGCIPAVLNADPTLGLYACTPDRTNTVCDNPLPIPAAHDSDLPCYFSYAIQGLTRSKRSCVAQTTFSWSLVLAAALRVDASRVPKLPTVASTHHHSRNADVQSLVSMFGRDHLVSLGP